MLIEPEADVLRVMVGERTDRVAALLDSDVDTTAGPLQTAVADHPAQGFQRLSEGWFGAGEMSLAFHAILTAEGRSPYVGVPVFPSRIFRHENILVSTGSDLRSPRDLVGLTVAVAEYSATMAVWLRAVLVQDYGIQPEQINWVVCRRPVVLPAGVGVPRKNVTVKEAFGSSPVELLLEGSVDAAFDFATSRSPHLRGSAVRCLFEDPWEDAKRYFLKTRAFPIMHLVVLRREVYEERPAWAKDLFDAFSHAKRLAEEALDDDTTLRLMLPRLPELVRQERELFGPSLWPYGVEANRGVLRMFLDHCWDQGLLARQLDVADLFVKESYELTDDSPS